MPENTKGVIKHISVAEHILLNVCDVNVVSGKWMLVERREIRIDLY